MTMSGWFDPSPIPWGPEWLFSLVIASSAKSAVVLASAALAALAMRRRSAAARHLVWTVAVAGSLSLPAFSAVLPGWWVALRGGRRSDESRASLTHPSDAETENSCRDRRAGDPVLA